MKLLKFIINLFVKKKPPVYSTEFCNPCCNHLSINETEQNNVYKKTGKKPLHYCNKYKDAVYHFGNHPNIVRLNICDESK